MPMTRRNAIAELARHELGRLGAERRSAILLDWWGVDSDCAEFESLPTRLTEVMTNQDEPGDPMEPIYEPLLELALRSTYIGVLNDYLEQALLRLGVTESVLGDVELLNACPCCGYRTLELVGEYEICKVCFWEDDGTVSDDKLSGPNHMTLGEARSNFRRLGAVSQAAVRSVYPDGVERYAKDAAAASSK